MFTRRGVKRLSRLWMLAGALLVGSAAVAEAGIVSPVQSPARPFGLDIAAEVQLAGSDARAAQFQGEFLPLARQVVSMTLAEKQMLSDQASIMLDPSQLRLTTDWDVRAYFVGEGAGYHNTLGYNTKGGGVDSGDPLLIFPDASSAVSYYDANANLRTQSNPLMPGDFVELGTVSAGTKLDFFLIANGVYGGKTVFSTDASVNRDGLEHVVSIHTVSVALKDSPYLVLGFEDLWGGGDQDFNDLVFAVDVGTKNVDGMVTTPEPATMVLMASFLCIAFWLSERMRRTQMA